MMLLNLSEYQRIYTPTEVAQILRVNEETIRREIRREQLRALQIGRQYRITAADLMAWLGEERYVEIFRPHEALLALLGAGDLGDAEVSEVAQNLVHRARAETVRQLDGDAPSPDEVRRRG